MTYHYDTSLRVICSTCNFTIVDQPDRHGCYWQELENEAFGSLVMTLRGQYETYNEMEKRIAKAIWERSKIKHKPRRVKQVPMFKTTNIEIYNHWCFLGNEVFGENI